MDAYRVNLDVYNGPLDLLLYLIRRDEVDIYDIPIAHVTAQYCKHIEMLKQLDPNLAGEFLVMAATLMEIKSRMLLPAPPPSDDGDQEGLGDPRAELVRQLLQYKAFKDAATALRSAADRQALRHPRRPVRPEFETGELDLEDVQVWSLLDAFNKLMAAIGRDRAVHEVIQDDTPLALHAEDILDRLQRDGDMTFAEIFAGREQRQQIVGLFLALLELIRQHRVAIQQRKLFDEIYVFLKDPGEAALDEGDFSNATGEPNDMIAFNDEYAPAAEPSADAPTPLRRNLINAAGSALDGLDDTPDPSPVARLDDDEDDWDDDEFDDDEFDDDDDDDEFDDDDFEEEHIDVDIDDDAADVDEPQRLN